MNKALKISSACITSVLLMFSIGNAHATVVDYTIIGDVVLGDEFGDLNAFGLTGGETITATGKFETDDLIVVAGVEGTIDFSFGSGNTMTITVGSETFTASNDTGYASGGPTISLNGYNPGTGEFNLTDFDFLAFLGTNGAAADFNSNFTSFDDFGFMFGDWQTTGTSAAVVAPVPAAVWLFGSGLLGLLGVARQKKA